MTLMNNEIDRILAVLVIYRLQIAESVTLQTLAESLKIAGMVLDLVIYDNSPESMLGIHETLPAQFRVSYLHDPSNPGVSKAYNEGLRVAHEQGKSWILLLDQDTSFPSDSIEKYIHAIENGQAQMYAPYLKSGNVTISPCFYWKGVGIPLKITPEGFMSLRNRSVLNSGMLVSVEAMTKIKGFDERIQLDFADHDFCRRFEVQYRKVLVLDFNCAHGFSDREENSLEKALPRFAFYCRGARYSARSLSDYVCHSLIVFIRSIVLTLRYRSLRFIFLIIMQSPRQKY